MQRIRECVDLINGMMGRQGESKSSGMLGNGRRPNRLNMIAFVKKSMGDRECGRILADHDRKDGRRPIIISESIGKAMNIAPESGAMLVANRARDEIDRCDDRLSNGGRQASAEYKGSGARA